MKQKTKKENDFLKEGKIRQGVKQPPKTKKPLIKPVGQGKRR